MNTEEIMLAVNLALCTAVGWICLCRLNLMNGDVMVRIRLAYIAIMLAATASGLQFWLWGTFPGWADLAFSFAVFTLQLASVKHWAKGVPKQFVSQFGDLI